MGPFLDLPLKFVPSVKDPIKRQSGDKPGRHMSTDLRFPKCKVVLTCVGEVDKKKVMIGVCFPMCVGRVKKRREIKRKRSVCMYVCVCGGGDHVRIPQCLFHVGDCTVYCT